MLVYQMVMKFMQKDLWFSEVFVFLMHFDLSTLEFGRFRRKHVVFDVEIDGGLIRQRTWAETVPNPPIPRIRSG